MKRFSIAAAAILMVLMLATVCSAAGGGQQIDFKKISVQELKKEMDSGQKMFLIDARTSKEYSEGHLPGAVNIGPDKFMFISGYLPQDRNYPLVIYCRGVG